MSGKGRPTVSQQEEERQLGLKLYAICDQVEDRWAGYWLSMEELLAKYDNGGFHHKTVRSAVYGDIEWNEYETALMSVPYVQRLRRISQTGLVHYVYPEAHHSRYDHTIGVLHYAHLFAQTLNDNEGKVRTGSGDKDPDGHVVPEQLMRTLEAAAALHDIGHGPFSHCTEMWEDSLGSPDGTWQSAPSKSQKGVNVSEAKAHEMLGARLIQDDFVAMAIVRKGLRRAAPKKVADLNRNGLGIARLLERLSVSSDSVAKMICGDYGDPKIGALTGIINGPLDADKMDYYQRDRYFTGSAGGPDIEYLLRHVRCEFDDKTKTIVRIYWPEKASNDLFYSLVSREYFNATTVYHPVCQTANAMLAAAFMKSIDVVQSLCHQTTVARDKKIAGRLLIYLPFMEDSDIWSILHICGSSACLDPLYNDCATVRNLTERLEARRLFVRQVQLSGVDRDAFVAKISGRNPNLVPQFFFFPRPSSTSGQCPEMTLVDTGWNPTAMKSYRQILQKVQQLLGTPKETPGPGIWIRSDRGSKQNWMGLDQCLMGNMAKPDWFNAQNPGRQSAKSPALCHDLDKGLAAYRYALSYVQILCSDGNSEDRRNHTVKQEKKIIAEVCTAHKDSLAPSKTSKKGAGPARQARLFRQELMRQSESLKRRPNA